MAKPVAKAAEILIGKKSSPPTDSVPFEPGKTDDTIPVSLYAQRFHKPYAAEFFGLDKNFLITLDARSTEKLQGIDDFIMEKMEEAELSDSKRSYNMVLNKLLAMLGINENEKAIHKIDKINKLILFRELLA